MKNSIFKFAILSFSIAFAAPSCSKDETSKPGFDLPFRQEFSIPAGLGTFVVHHFYFHNLPTHFAQLLTENHKTAAEISSILPKTGQLSGVFGDANFDFIEEASLRVYTEPDETDYLETFYRYPTPLTASNILGLVPGLGTCQRFVSEERVSIDLALRLRRTTDEETSTRMDFTFRAYY